MTVEEMVRQILVKDPRARNYDKYVMAHVWYNQGIIREKTMSIEDFIYRAELPENIRRSRQKLQAKYSELEPTDPKVRKARGFKEQMKGEFTRIKEVGEALF